MAKETQKQKTEAGRKPAIPDIGQKAYLNMLSQVESFASIDGTPLTDEEKTFAAPIVFEVIKRVDEYRTFDEETKQQRKIVWQEVDVKGVVQQIKDYARLKLSITDNELYVDIRKNGKTGLFDVTIKKQYQGIQKEIRKWSVKKIVRYLEDIICEGDEFETETDFNVGLRKVVKHVKNTNVNRNDLKNIVGAYAIAYVEENEKLNQYMVEIDKDRIMRAYNASPTKEKPIWKADTKRMVIKSAIWSLYNYVLKPFVQVPVELKEAWHRTNEKPDFNVYDAEIVAQEEIAISANTGEVIDVEEKEEQPEPVKVEVKPEAPKPADKEAAPWA